MSETHSRSATKRLQDIQEGLDALLATYGDNPGKLESIYSAYQMADHMQSLAPKDIDSQLLSTLEEFVQDGNTSNANVASEETTLHEQAMAFLDKFERLGDLQDLERAITSQQRALDITPDSHPNKPAHLGSLGMALLTRFEQLGFSPDLEAAILRVQGAVDLTPDGHPNKPVYLNNLGAALIRRFERVGSLADMEAAISRNQQAVALTPAGHPNEATCLDNLGTALRKRFERSGSLADLDNAILQKRKAVDLTPNGHPSRPRYLTNLGNMLEMRFQRHGSLRDLEEAILQQRKAVSLIPDGHPNKATYFNNLGDALAMRFDQHGSLIDLEDAILHHRRAVDITLDDHPGKPGYLSDLGAALERRFRRGDSLADLEEAILQQRMAVNLTPDDHHDKPRRLHNLASASVLKFHRNDTLSDLDDSILQMQKAIHHIPTGHPARTLYLTDLSKLLRIRLTALEDQDDLQRALSATQEAAESSAASSRLRLQAALAWADCCTLGSTSSLPAYGCAIKLLPRVAWLGITMEDQYALLAEVGSATLDAVAAAVAEDDYETAVEWAEQGRSIVWQNLLGLRTPLDGLRSRYPDLTLRLQELSRRLERPTEIQDVSSGSMISDTTGDQMALAMERDRLIDEVRSKPGFERFMQPKSFEELAPAARDGAVVLLNLGEARCDALALLPDGNGASHIVPIPLERVTLQGAQQLSTRLVKLLSKTGLRARDSRKHMVPGASDDKSTVIKGILKTLWLDYVQPILDGLAYQVNVESPPRLWWCTTGPLAFLPLHAAGLYDTNELGHKLSDYVVSSYTPTLRVLLEAPSSTSSNEHQILAVAISNTPGAPLPCTEEEALNLRHMAANLPVVSLMNEEATQDRVLEELKRSTWAHLACHGEQVGGKPMESGLILHDGKLELSEIVKTRLPKADFAFLSACQTAVGDGGVPEESAHLAAGMLFAGYQGVVATMWSIQDDIAPRVAEDFYRYLFRNGQPKRTEAAYALHMAVRSLQESGVPFTSWVPFIHIGR